MFPHTVTVYNVIATKNSIKYQKQTVSDVFCHVNKIISPEGRGEKYTYAYDVIFSSKALNNWTSKQSFEGSKDTFTLRENDIIALGKTNEIEDIADLKKAKVDFFFIKTVSENLYGDKDIQNIEVTN